MTQRRTPLPPPIAHSVLFVDDDDANLELARFAFGDDFDVYTASSGERALELMAERPFAVVVCDQRMPGMTGVQVCARAREVAPHTVRVIITAYADSEGVVDAINEGAVSRYLTKPFRDHELAEVLREEVSRYSDALELRRVGSAVLHEGLPLAARAAEAEIAHDVNNMLTPASMLLQTSQTDLEALRARGSASADELADLASNLDEVAASLAVLQSFVHGLREGNTRLARGEADLGLVVDATARMFGPRVDQTADMELRIQSGAIVALEPSGLTQVFVNLLVNALDALDAAQARGHILVQVERDGDVARLQVTDDGEGIADENLKNIFESGYTTRTTGTGRGLAIARRIVRSAGGELIAERTDEGNTRFRVTLPILRATSERPQVPPSKAV